MWNIMENVVTKSDLYITNNSVKLIWIYFWINNAQASPHAYHFPDELQTIASHVTIPGGAGEGESAGNLPTS